MDRTDPATDPATAPGSDSESGQDGRAVRPRPAGTWRKQVTSLALVLTGAWAASTGLQTLVQAWQARELDRDWQAAARSAATQAPDVLVYSREDCPYCAQAHDWMRRHGVRWRDCPIDTNADCLSRYGQLGSPGVPLIAVGNSWMLGWRAREFITRWQQASLGATPR